MSENSLITLTRPEFENLMETQGLTKTVEGVLSIANDELETGGVPLTLESLTTGTHPILNNLDRYRDLDPEDRGLAEEEILTLFTNVEDFGKFDPEDDSSSGVEAFFSGAGRMLPEAVGAGAGFKGGLAAAAPIANLIPPVGLPGLLLKGVVLGVGGIGGSIAGAIAASEAEDAIIGEADPVIPSLEGKYRGGESTVIGVSMLTSPWKFFSSTPKATTGALEFLDNFKKVSSGKFASIADEAFELTAKNAGLSEKAFKAANAARGTATRGPMFGGSLGANLGFTRFNPAGYLVDPRKGPVGARIVGGIESGIDKSMKFARDNPGKFLSLEGVAAGGIGLGASVAQDIDPYDETTRFYSELIGSAVVPLPAQFAIDLAPDAVSYLKRWYGNTKNKEGLLKGKMSEEAVNRIMLGIQRSEEYADTLNEQGELVVSADEKFAKFIDGLIEASEDADGNPLPLTSADLAELSGLPFSPTLRTIQDELAKSNKDLKVATGRGREELQAGAVNAIRTLASTGDTRALGIAARIQQGLFEQNITDQIEDSVTKLTTAGQRVVGRKLTEASRRGELSVKLYDVLKNNIDLSKARERRLWNEVGSYPITQFISRNGKEITQPNVLQILDRPALRNGLKFSSEGANKELRTAIGPYMEDIDALRDYFQKREGRNPATADRFFKIRSGLLNRASTLRKNGDLENAGYLDRLANEVLRDLTGQVDDASAAYNTARAYTFARNNVFTRTFLNRLQVIDKNRGVVMDPMTLLDEAFRGGNLATARRFDQIRAAGRFLVDEAKFSEEQVQLMNTDQIISESLRDSLAKIMDKKTIPNPANPNESIETFVVNKSKLENFKKQPGTKELFALIPKLEDDLSDVVSAQSTFDNMLTDVSDKINPTAARQRGFSDEQVQNMYKTKAFQWVLNYEDPGKAVAKALASERPTLALNSLYKMVSTADMAGSGYTREQALSGLRSSIINNALVKANNSVGLPNGDILQKELFGQMKGVDPSIKFSMEDFLIKNNLYTQDEMNKLQEAIKTLRGVEEAFQKGDLENVLFKNPSLAKLFYLRIAGATAGGAFQNKLKNMLGLPTMGGGLIAEQTGSEMVQRLLLRGPESQTLQLMGEYLSNPKALGLMMKDIKKKKDLDDAMKGLSNIFAPLARQVGRRIPLGVRTIEEDVLEEYETPVEEEPVPAPALDTPTASAVPVSPMRSVAPPPMSPQPSPLAMTPPPAASGPVDRRRFAAMFPEDRDLVEGIGSLMG